MKDVSSATRLVRPLRGGQVTIPAEFLRQLGIDEHTMLQMRLDNGELHIKPVHLTETSERAPWLQDLYAYFEPVRQEILDRDISEAEINTDIDAAIEAVRAGQRSDGWESFWTPLSSSVH